MSKTSSGTTEPQDQVFILAVGESFVFVLLLDIPPVINRVIRIIEDLLLSNVQ
jgi:hypothetical protein